MSEHIDRRTFASVLAVTAIGTAAATARIAAAQAGPPTGPLAAPVDPGAVQPVASQPAASPPAPPPVQPPVDPAASTTPESWMRAWLDDLQARYPVPSLTPEQRELVVNDLMDQARLGRQLASIPLDNAVAPGVWFPQLAK